MIHPATYFLFPLSFFIKDRTLSPSTKLPDDFSKMQSKNIRPDNSYLFIHFFI